MNFFVNPGTCELIFIAFAVSYLGGLFWLLAFVNEVVRTDFSGNANRRATVYYYLPESIFNIKVNAKVAVVYNTADNSLNNLSKVIEINFTVSTDMIADTQELLSLNYVSNIFTSDDVKYLVNAKGLLETVNAITTDMTPNIVSKLTEVPKELIAKKGAMVSVPQTTTVIKDYEADFVVKATAITSLPTLIPWNLIVTNELGGNDYINVSADFEISTTDQMTTGMPVIDLINDEKAKKDKSINGLLTRPLKNMSLQLVPVSVGLPKGLPINVVVADNTKLIVIPINRTAFGQRTNNVGIQSGIVISNEIKNPSVVEGFISIPINIAKAIFSLPGQIIQFKFDNTQRLNQLETEKLAYETALWNYQKNSMNKELAIETAKIEMEKVKLANSIALQKAMIENQNNLSETQRSLLETKEKILELEQKIEALQKPPDAGS